MNSAYEIDSYNFHEGELRVLKADQAYREACEDYHNWLVEQGLDWMPHERGNK